MNKPRIYFRADGNSQMGLGHVIRSCALASILKQSFDCTFFIREPSEYLTQQIHDSGSKLVSLPVVDSYESEAAIWADTFTGKEIIVLDGYQFNTVYQRRIKDSQCKLVCIDDIHAGMYMADVVINHAGGTQISQYQSAFYTQFFLGFKYSLLRKPFLSNGQNVRNSRELLICLGGADPFNDTQKVYELAVSKEFEAIHVLIGAAYQFRSQLEAIICKNFVPTTLHQNLDAAGVAALMQQCSHAVLSPSSIVLEYMSVGGSVYLFQIADNQKYLKNYLLENGLAKDFAELGAVSSYEEHVMVHNQRNEFDGKSGVRLLQIFSSLAFINGVSIDRATAKDVELTFLWVNEPVSRQMSYNKSSISKEEHYAWFFDRVAAAETHYYILRSANTPFAQIRFDKKNNFYLLSYFIAPAFRGKSLGSFILAEGLRRLKQDLLGKEGIVIGYVKKDNISSCRSFEKLGFLKEETTDYPETFKYTIQF